VSQEQVVLMEVLVLAGYQESLEYQVFQEMEYLERVV
jgi:hypothetical protein